MVKWGQNPKDLQNLYAKIMEEAIYISGNTPEDIDKDWKLVHAIMSLAKPLSCNAIAELIPNSKKAHVEHLINRLQAVFYVDKESKAVFTFHASFADFITKNGGTQAPNLKLPKYEYRIQHDLLSRACFQMLLSNLCFNMCTLTSSFLLDTEVVNLRDTLAARIGETLVYCCHFWSFHLMESNLDQQMIVNFGEFLKEKGIFWIEAMSLQNQLGKGGEYMENVLHVSQPKFVM